MEYNVKLDNATDWHRIFIFSSDCCRIHEPKVESIYLTWDTSSLLPESATYWKGIKASTCGRRILLPGLRGVSNVSTSMDPETFR